MEGHLENSPKQGYPAYREDENVEKCVLGLGTTLVATFEEAKERISQIEHIFCSQIFPTFQLKSENLQNFFPEGKKAREDACKEKENDLILPIERLQCEKQQALEENQSLKLEWEYEEKTKELLAKVNGLERKVNELQDELRRKDEKVVEGKKLIKLVDSKRSFRKKTHEVEEGRQLRAQLQQQIVWNDTEMSKNKQHLKEYEEENNLLMYKIIGLKLKNNELMVNHGDHGNKVSDTSEAPCDTVEVNNICFKGSLEDVKDANLIQAPRSDSYF
nr:protein gamma response 1 [Quercus suber]